MAEQDLTKLPKWAQTEILRLRANEAAHHRLVARDLGGNWKNLWVPDPSHERFDEKPSLHTRGRFILDENPRRWIDFSRAGGDTVKVMGSYALVVMPATSNVFDVTLRFH